MVTLLRAAYGPKSSPLSLPKIGDLTFLLTTYPRWFARPRDCAFRVRPEDQGELYEGVIKKFGLDAGITNNAILAWTVLAPAHVPVYQGVLMGRYAGVAADASIGVGGGANVLIGGSNDAISLQPLSIQGQTGINVALAWPRLNSCLTMRIIDDDLVLTVALGR